MSKYILVEIEKLKDLFKDIEQIYKIRNISEN
jgi:hypothetical protein